MRLQGRASHPSNPAVLRRDAFVVVSPSAESTAPKHRGNVDPDQPSPQYCPFTVSFLVRRVLLLK